MKTSDLRAKDAAGLEKEVSELLKAHFGLRMIKVSLKNGTIHHKVVGEHGASRVLMAPAKPGDGIIAGGPMRAVFEVMGVTDIVCKSLGSSNPYNIVRATLDGLKRCSTPAEIAAKRGLTVEEIVG